MRNPLRVLALGLFFYVFFLAKQLPASVIAGFLLPSEPQQAVYVEGITGSAWSGRIAYATVQGFNFGTIQWTLAPLDLLRFRARGHFSAHRPGFALDGKFTAKIGGTVEINDLRGNFELADLAATDLLVPGIGGTITLQFSDLVTKELNVSEASGNVRLSRLRLAWIPGTGLGSYQARVTNTPEALQVDISNIDGPLVVDLALNARPASQGVDYTLIGTISARGGADPVLASALQWLGTPDSTGQYRVRQSGTFHF